MVQVTKQTVQQWVMIDYLAQKYHYGEMVGQMERKYGMPYAEFEKRIESAEKEEFDEWDDYIEWGAYVGYLEEVSQQIEEIRQGNFQLIN